MDNQHGKGSPRHNPDVTPSLLGAAEPLARSRALSPIWHPAPPPSPTLVSLLRLQLLLYPQCRLDILRTDV